METKTYTDSRINNCLAFYQYMQIANEYLQMAFGGDRVLGGATMRWETFETMSYRRGNLPQVDIVIDYAKQTITLSTR